MEEIALNGLVIARLEFSAAFYHRHHQQRFGDTAASTVVVVFISSDVFASVDETTTEGCEASSKVEWNVLFIHILL